MSSFQTGTDDVSFGIMTTTPLPLTVDTNNSKVTGSRPLALTPLFAKANLNDDDEELAVIKSSSYVSVDVSARNNNKGCANTPLLAPATTVGSSTRVNGLLLRTPVLAPSNPRPYSRLGNPSSVTVEAGAQRVTETETPFFGAAASIGSEQASNNPSGYPQFSSLLPLGNTNNSFNSVSNVQRTQIASSIGQSPPIVPTEAQAVAPAFLATPTPHGFLHSSIAGPPGGTFVLDGASVSNSSIGRIPTLTLNNTKNPLTGRVQAALRNASFVSVTASPSLAPENLEPTSDDRNITNQFSSGKKRNSHRDAEVEPLHVFETKEQKRARLLESHQQWVATLSPYDPRKIFFTAFPEGLLPQGSIGGSAFNLATNTLGAGTIALPAAFSAAGGLLGFIVLLACLFAAIYAMRLQVVVTEHTGMKSYAQKARLLVGVWAEKVIAVIVIVLSWGVTIVYVVAIGDLLDTFRLYEGTPELLQGPWGRRLVTTAFWAVFMLPLSLPAQINTLRYASLAGLAATLLLVISLVVYAGTTTVNEITYAADGTPTTTEKLLARASNIPVAHLNLGAIMAFPVFIFGTACHTNTYQVYSELTNKSPRRMTIVAIVTMTAVGILYLSCGLTGVAIFGDKTESNILSNFSDPLGQWYITVAFFGMAVTLTTAFPLCIFPARDAVLQLIGINSIEQCPTYIRIPLSGLIATLSLLVGLFVPGVTIMFGLLGGLLCSTVVYICPAVFALRCGMWTRESVGTFNIIATWALLVFGVIAGIFGTGVSIYGLA